QKLAFENTSKRLEIGAANTFEWESQKTQMENAEITKLMDKYTYLFNIKILEFYLGKPLKL
ncbi:MAG: TolC family protein, partial [Bacteroidia bacterium]|nr:TolC family protein [Bacteroidia bacterium]